MLDDNNLRMKNLKILCVFLIFLSPFVIANGQKRKTTPVTKQTIAMDFTRLEQLVDKYLSDKVNGNGGETALTGLSIYYGGLSVNKKKMACKCLMKRIDKSYDNNEMPKALLLSDLYESFSPNASDPNFAKIYYIRGERAATDNDTIMLKTQIERIESCIGTGAKIKETYLENLRSNLEDIRNYVPVDKTIDGTWVSELTGKTCCEPYFILEIKQSPEDKPIFTLRNYTGFLSFVEKPVMCQDEYAFTNDSVYVVFSNEDLRKPSPLLNGLLRTYGNTYASIVGMKAAQNSGSSFAGSLTEMATSMVVDAAADALFAPRKYSYLLEFKLRKVNDWQMEADVALNQVTVKGDNEPKYINYKWHSLFTKIRREDNWFWYTSGEDNMSIPFDMGKSEKKAFIEKRKCPKSWMYFKIKPIQTFNLSQLIKMMYLTESRLLADGEVISDSTNLHKQLTEQRRQVVLGIEFAYDSKCIEVKKAIAGYPAERAGIKKGDIITHADGYELSTPQQFAAMMKGKLPYQKVVLTVERKKKKLDVAVETCLSF